MHKVGLEGEGEGGGVWEGLLVIKGHNPEGKAWDLGKAQPMGLCHASNMMVDFAIAWLKWIPPTRKCSTTCCKVKACNIIGSHYYMFPLFFSSYIYLKIVKSKILGGRHGGVHWGMWRVRMMGAYIRVRVASCDCEVDIWKNVGVFQHITSL